MTSPLCPLLRTTSRAATRATLCVAALTAAALASGCQAGAAKKAAPRSVSDIRLGSPVEPGPAATLGFSVSWVSFINTKQSGRIGYLRALGDAVVAVERGGDRVTALDAHSGALRWIRGMGERLQPLSAPVRVGSNIFVNTESHLHRMDAVTGRMGQTVELKTPVAAEPAVLENFLVFSGLNGNVIFFNLHTNYPTWEYQLQRTIRTHPVVFGRSAFAVDSGGKYAMLSVERRELAWVGHTWGSTLVDPVLYKDTLLVTSSDGSIYGINRSTGADMWRYANLGKSVVKQAPFVVSASAQALVSVEGEGLRVLSITSGAEIGRIATRAVPVMATASGKVILCDEAKCTLTLVDLPSGRPIVSIPTLPLSNVVATPDGALIIVGKDGQVMRLDPLAP